MDRWDLLLPHTELTLNLLRHSPTQASAWENLFGPYNFDATPIGPAGCRVLMHNKATLQKSWDYRCREGFYVGPALKHYRCYQVLGKDTRALAISDAVHFRHHKLPGPAPTTADKLLCALQRLNATLAGKIDTTCQDLLAAIEALRTLLHSTTVPISDAPTVKHSNTPPTASPPAPPPRGDPQAAPLRVDNAGWTTVQRRSLRINTTRSALPIATHTRSLTSNAFAALASIDDDTDPVALPVLDEATGTLLEHR